MRLPYLLCSLLPLLASPALAQPADAPTRVAGPQALNKDELDATLYALGLSVGQSLGVFALSPAELEQVFAGIKDATADTMKPELLTATPRIKDLELQRREKRLTLEKERGRRYAATAAKEAGAQVSPSGLIYTVVSEGIGPSPSPVDTVRVHYRGRLIDGREFDSSYKRGEPASFSLRQVVPCWTEALQKMKTNGRARLVCPAAIAYGDKGSPPNIPPGATLLFDVELLEVVARGPTSVK